MLPLPVCLLADLGLEALARFEWAIAVCLLSSPQLPHTHRHRAPRAMEEEQEGCGGGGGVAVATAGDAIMDEGVGRCVAKTQTQPT
jgi:hypothetical protein